MHLHVQAHLFKKWNSLMNYFSKRYLVLNGYGTDTSTRTVEVPTPTASSKYKNQDQVSIIWEKD